MKKLYTLVLILCPFLSFSQTIDPTFNATVTSNAQANGVWFYDDGTYLVWGDFQQVNGQNIAGLVKFNADGTINTAFSSGAGAVGSVHAAVVQSDGKIVVAGRFTSYNGTAVNNIMRLNAAGTIDGSFAPNLTLEAFNQDIRLALQSDGKILLAAPVQKAGATAVNSDFIRLTTTGAYDATFNSPDFNGSLSDIAIQSDGKIIVGGSFTSADAVAKGYIARLNTNGTLDNTFATGVGFDNSVEAVEIVSASQIIVGGYFTTYNGAAMKGLVALNSTGGVATYAMNGKPNQNVYGLHKQTDGKVVAVGSFTTVNAVSKNRIARFNTDGTLDATFATGTGPDGFLQGVTGNASNDIVVTSQYMSTFNGTARPQLAIVTVAGALKSMTELMNIQTANRVEDVVKYNSSQFLITHIGNYVNGVASAGFERLNLDGTLDNTFHANTATIAGARSVVVDGTGRIIIGGYFTTINGNSMPRIARLDANGNLDMTFRTNVGTGFQSSVTALALQSDGKIIAGGAFTSFNGNTIHKLARLNADGTFDNTFNTANGFSTTSGTVEIETIVVQADGKILVGGTFAGFAGNTMKSLIRLNTDGSVDPTFNTGTGFMAWSGNATIFAIQVLSDGKILVGGHITQINGVDTDNYVRLTSTGARDATFNPTFNNIIEKLEKTTGGNILILDREVLQRALPDGTIDDTFAPITMPWSWNEDVAEFGNQIIVGGFINGAGAYNESGLTKVLIPPAPATPTTLNGSASSPTQIGLTWTDAANNENGFKIERSLNSSTGFTQIAKVNSNVTAYTDNTVVANTTYYYRVYAYNAGGVSAYSNVKSITTPEAIPNAPTNLQISVQAPTTLRLTWTDASSNEANFIVRRSTDNVNFTIVGTLAANTTSFDNTGLTVGTRYYYRVTSKNTAGESTIASVSGLAGAYNMTAGTLTTCEGVFFDPGGEGNYSTNMNITTTLTPSNAGSSVSLEFTAFQTVAGWDALSIYDGSNASAPLIGTYSGTASPGTVVASNVNGTLTLVFTSSTQSPQSGWRANIGCLVIPAKPTNLAVSAFNTNTTKLTWTDNAAIETGYSLERSVGNTSSFAVIATLPANTTTYQDNTVDKNITYYYKLRALGASNHSGYTSLAGIAFGDGGVWTLKTDMNGVPRTDAVAFGIGDKGYVGTGITGSYAMDMRIYDAATNVWSTAAAYGGSIRAEAASFVINGKGYVGTGEGFDLEKDLWEYNPTNNAWTQKANFPGTARRNAVAFSANGIGYVGLGTDGALKNDFYSYNPTNNTWTAIATFPGVARQGAVAFSINNIGYVGTGTGSSGKVKDFYKYDPTTNVWTKIADFPGTARTEAVAFVVGGKGYVGTGESNADEKDFYSYDPSTNAWTKIVSFGGTARFVATAFETTTKGYVGTGFDGANRNDFWEFVNTTVQSPPAAPSGVTVTVLSASQLKIDWTDNATNETGYSLERSTGNETSYAEIASLPANTTTYTNTGLTSNTRYYYRLKALSTAVGNSGYSASANGTTLPLPPAAPTTLTTTVLSHSQIKLNWVDASSNETEFVIMRSLVSNQDFVEIATTLPNVTTFTNDGLAEATTYYYKVFARNTGGSSAMTPVAQGTTQIAPVVAPSALQVISTSFDKITLSWTDNSTNETEFHLERSTDNVIWDKVYVLAPNTIDKIDVQVVEATTYYYRIKAKSALGESGYSSTVSATTPKSVPLAPSNLALSYDEVSTIMTLTWTDNSFNEEEFIIERSTDGVTFEEIGTSTTSGYEDMISLVHIARYRVLARNSAGNSGYSNIASQVVTGIEENSFEATVTLSPNPATEKIAIGVPQGKAGEVQLEMYNAAGVLLKSERFIKGQAAITKTVRVEELPKGLIMIRIVHHGAVAVKKVVLE